MNPDYNVNTRNILRPVLAYINDILYNRRRDIKINITMYDENITPVITINQVPTGLRTSIYRNNGVRRVIYTNQFVMASDIFDILNIYHIKIYLVSKDYGRNRILYLDNTLRESTVVNRMVRPRLRIFPDTHANRENIPPPF